MNYILAIEMKTQHPSEQNKHVFMTFTHPNGLREHRKAADIVQTYHNVFNMNFFLGPAQRQTGLASVYS